MSDAEPLIDEVQFWTCVQFNFLLIYLTLSLLDCPKPPPFPILLCVTPDHFTPLGGKGLTWSICPSFFLNPLLLDHPQTAPFRLLNM